MATLTETIPLVQSASVLPAADQVYEADFPKKPGKTSCCKKIKKIFWNVISVLIPIIGIMRILIFLFKRVIMYCLLPQLKHNQHTEAKMAEIKSAYPDSYRITIKTPLKAELDGMVFPGTSGKVIVYALERNSSYENTALNQMTWLKKTNATVIFVNPPGVEKSTGFPSPEGLALGIYSTYEYIMEEMSIPLSDTLLYGRSMGGCYGNLGLGLVQKKHPGTPLKVINERSFSNLSEEIYELLRGGSESRWRKKLAKVGAIGIGALGLQMDSAAVFNKLNNGIKTDESFKAVIYHEKDLIIPLASAMFTALHPGEAGKITTIGLDSEHKQPENCSLKQNNFNHSRQYTETETAMVVEQIDRMLSAQYIPENSETIV